MLGLTWADLTTNRRPPLPDLSFMPDQIIHNGHQPIQTGSTWTVADLTPHLDGTYVAPETSIGAQRSDGLPLLYSGRLHFVTAEPECGKTWLALYCVAEQLARDPGSHIVYSHCEEPHPADTVGRLLALGVPADVIRDRFHFVGPSGPVDAFAMDALTAYRPALAVVDGVTEAMSMHGLLPDADGFAQFRRKVVIPFIESGAAVVLLDHPPKNRDTRAVGPAGTFHKMASADGVMYSLERKDPFAPGKRGRSLLYGDKDRAGHVRSRSTPAANAASPGRFYVGSFQVDAHEPWEAIPGQPAAPGYLAVGVYYSAAALEREKPDTGPAGRTESDVDRRVLDSVRSLEAERVTPNTRTIRARYREDGSKGDNYVIGAGLDRLIARGLIARHKEGQANVYSSVPDPTGSAGPHLKVGGQAEPLPVGGSDRFQTSPNQSEPAVLPGETPEPASAENEGRAA